MVNLPKGKKSVRCKWIFTTKYKADKTIERYKMRFMKNDYKQTYGIEV